MNKQLPILDVRDLHVSFATSDFTWPGAARNRAARDKRREQA